MRTVALAALGFGVTDRVRRGRGARGRGERGPPRLGGLLLSAWSISSVAFGVLYAMRPWPKSMHLRLPALLGGFGALSLLLAIPTTLIWLGVTMLLVGTLVTPQATTHSAAIEQVAPKGTATEAFGWVITAVTVGLAIGQSISGYLVEHVGTPVAFLAAGGRGCSWRRWSGCSAAPSRRVCPSRPPRSAARWTWPLARVLPAGRRQARNTSNRSNTLRAARTSSGSSMNVAACTCSR